MSPLDRLLTQLAGVPALPGARCKGRADLFERTIAMQPANSRATRDQLKNARSAALRLCAACPALDPCRAWLASQLPTRRPRGVVAGQLITSAGLPAKTGMTVELPRDRQHRVVGGKVEK